MPAQCRARAQELLYTPTTPEIVVWDWRQVLRRGDATSAATRDVYAAVDHLNLQSRRRDWWTAKWGASTNTMRTSMFTRPRRVPFTEQLMPERTPESPYPCIYATGHCNNARDPPYNWHTCYFCNSPAHCCAPNTPAGETASSLGEATRPGNYDFRRGQQGRAGGVYRTTKHRRTERGRGTQTVD